MVGASERINQLIEALSSDATSEVRLAALNALDKLVINDDQPNDILGDVLNDVLDDALVDSLYRLVLDDANSAVRKSALEILTEIGFNSEKPITALATAFDDLALEVSLAAVGIMRENSDQILTMIVQMLDSHNDDHRWAASLLAGRISLDRFKPLVSEFVSLIVNHQNCLAVRRTAIDTLARQSNHQINSLAEVKQLESWVNSHTEGFNQAKFTEALASTLASKQEPRIPTIEKPGTWKLVFYDDFNEESLDKTKWSYNCPRRDKAYMPMENIIVANGLLTIKAANEMHTDRPTSGIITTYNKFHFTQGYIEARIKVPNENGFWPAFRLLGAGWPPEVGIMEIVAGNADQLHTNYHYGPSWNNKWSHYQNFRVDNLAADFNIYGFEWFPTYMKWYLNGEQIGMAFTDQEWIAQSRNMYILLNLAVDDQATKLPGYMQVDWVRVWQNNY